MTLTQSIATFLHQQGGTFCAADSEDPVNALATKLGRKRGEVRAALNLLVREDRIWIRRTGGVLPPAVGLYRRRRSTPVTAEGKRQHRFARDVPAFLPNSMCGPVTVRFATSNTKAGDQQMQQPQPLKLQDDFEDLTQILGALQKWPTTACTTETECRHEYGVPHALLNDTNGCVQLIMKLFPQLTKSRAERLNGLLGNAGVRFSQRLGNAKYAHFIRLDVTEVTPNMLHRQDDSVESEGSANMTESPLSAEDEQSTASVAIAKPQEDAADEVVQLLEYVQTLEKTVEKLQDENAALEESLIEERQRVSSLEREASLTQQLRGVLARAKAVNPGS